MKLSIIIPCYNEEQTIKPLLNSLLEVNFPIDREIIIVDDGSRKDHREFIKEDIQRGNAKFIRLPRNQGKGVAIRIGLKYATGDIFIIQDADFEYFPSDIPKLLRPILNKETEVVYGTRFFSKHEQMSNSHLIGNIFLTRLTNFLYKSEITDMETGYKLFTKKVLRSIVLYSREFEFEPEITAKILLNGFKIKEIPITYKYRVFDVAKINWFDGLESALILVQYRFFNNSKIFRYCLRIYKYQIKKAAKKIQNKIMNKLFKNL